MANTLVAVQQRRYAQRADYSAEGVSVNHCHARRPFSPKDQCYGPNSACGRKSLSPQRAAHKQLQKTRSLSEDSPGRSARHSVASGRGTYERPRSSSTASFSSVLRFAANSPYEVAFSASS
jgi:hypothetical protein